MKALRALFSLLVAASVCFGEAPSLQEQVAAAAESLEKELSAVVGIAATDLRSGATMADHRGQEKLIPASNQKLLTSAFALVRLGEGFQFTTTLYLVGGNLLVVGDGDPTPGDPVLAAAAGGTIYDDLDSWAGAVKAETGGSLNGDIIVCDPHGPESYRHPDWPAAHHSEWYAAPVATLNFNNNCLDIALAIEGDKVMAGIKPESRFITVVNKVSRGKRQNLSARLAKDDSQLAISGTVAGGTTEPVNVAVNDPPLLLGRVLADRLLRAGVSFAGQVRRAEPGSIDLAGAQVICRKVTPLGVVLARAGKRSLNMAAECVFLRAGDGTWSGSAALMTKTLVETYGLKEDELVIRDGGGLSRSDRITPAGVVKVLSATVRRPDAHVFLASLPASGVDGTMKKRLDKPPYRGRVLGKTGYIAGVSSLSGYVLDGSGKPAIAFSILANKVPGGKGWRVKQLQDRICQWLLDSLSTAAE
jgi:D-alanyl-D-alanine carboxypeptidase/D-alanyl-D-alanine-endopeptidase (penicillin-binding protein 4)